MLKRLTAIDLFAGCGGLTQGLKDAGFAVLAAVEVDNLALETYSANHKEVHLVAADIRQVSAADLRTHAGVSIGGLDLLAGCPPCQGFSRLRNRNRCGRLDDSRNRLIQEFLRLTEGLLPRVVMLENVPALARYTRYKSFMRRLRTLGYTVAQRVVNVADFGVPQRRTRLVMLASRLGAIEHPLPTLIRRTVRDAIGTLPVPARSSDPLHNHGEHRSDRVRALIAAVGLNGGSRSALGKDLSLRCHEESDGFHDVYGRMRWDDVAPTVTSGCINPSKGRFLHPTDNRAITVREASLLQSFPPDYIFSMRRGKYAVAEMIGNALPPAFTRIQAGAIRNHLLEMSLRCQPQ